MKKTILFILVSAMALSASADDGVAKYLAGAVPEVDGQVRFTRNIKINTAVSQEKLFELVKDWAFANYDDITEGSAKEKSLLSAFAKDNASKNEKGISTNKKVLFVSQEEGYIICQGDDELIFQPSLLSRDVARLNYQLVLTIIHGNIKMDFRRLRYDYSEYNTLKPAEALITDEVAMHNGKLIKFYDKFRTFTIDKVDELENALKKDLSQVILEDVMKSPSILDTDLASEQKEIIEVETSGIVSMEGYKHTEIDNIPEIVKQLMSSEDWVIINSSRGATTIGSWADFADFWGKSTANSIINPAYDNSSGIADGQIYTISFISKDTRKSIDAEEYSLKNAKLATIQNSNGVKSIEGAWMVIECKKMVSSSVPTHSIKNKNLDKKWKEGDNYRIIVGEVVNVWIK